jgi:uncharacterized Ntn-hydrolase superfamily protein
MAEKIPEKTMKKLTGIHPSTFSIAAYDPQENAWGVAVASKFPAAGAVVPFARAGQGAIATQAYANTSFGPLGLDLLASGLGAEAVLAQLLAADPGREQRQVGLVDSKGASATFTGQECSDWAGGLTGNGYAIQGNILAGPGVLPALESAFLHTPGDLATRLHAGLLAADRAGGDRRGRQSAALLVVKDKGGYGGYNDRLLDYRVDDDPDPVVKLGELLELHRLYFGKSPETERLPLTGQPLTDLQAILVQLGHLRAASGQYDAATREAFRAFTGNENFEERCDVDAGWIDSPVFNFILRKFGQ